MNNSSFRFRFLMIFSCSKICMVFLCIQQSIEAISDKKLGVISCKITQWLTMGKSTICRFQGFLKHFDQITFGGGRRMQQLLTWSTSPIETSSCYKLRARLSRHTTPSSAIEQRILKCFGIKSFLKVYKRRQIFVNFLKYPNPFDFKIRPDKFQQKRVY